jgi:predicted alpha/beta superfamily hydrolase
VQVWLPPGYAQASAQRYPVLYLHDGQMKFDAVTAGAEWHADESAQRMALSGEIAPFIMVAIAHSGEGRMLDYTPTKALLPGPQIGKAQAEMVGGGAKNYARYLIEELKPMIDARYRTQPSAAHTAVGGASLGGLVSAWLALHHADVFGAALVVSPLVWWDDEFIVRDVLAAPLVDRGARPKIWLDMGEQEGGNMIPAVRNLRNAFMKRGWKSGLNGDELRYFEIAQAGHDEQNWAARFPQMLQFLYPVGKVMPK